MDNKRVYFGQIKKENVKQQHKQPNEEEEEEEAIEFLPFSKHTKKSQEQHQKVLDEFERRKRAKQVIVPTIDNSIKLKLRELSEPIILFGEKPEDRRSRLRNILIERNILDGTPLLISNKKQQEAEEALDESDEENFLTEGTDELKQARLEIALYSLKKSQKRLLESKLQREQELKIQKDNEILKENYENFQIQQQQQQLNGDNMDIDSNNNNYNNNNLEKIKTKFEKQLEDDISELKNYYASVSQIGDDRQLSMGVFSPDGQLVGISSWSGQSKLWSVNGEHKITYTGHTQRVSSIAFHPQSTLNGYSGSNVNLATTSADSTCKLWSLESSTPILSLEGHTDVVNRCCFHPCGRFITTTSSDKSWRLWDIENAKCLLDQEGHSDLVMGVAIQPSDGALIATGSQDGLVRIWDLRSGRPILYFQGHSKQVISVDWSPNQYQLASSSEDNTVIIWDIRKKEQSYQILAHNSIVSCVKFQKPNSTNGSGTYHGSGYLATCAFDGKIKTWSPLTWKPITTLEGHSSKVTSVDISSCSSKILSTSFDKTWKIWSNDN